MPLPEPFDYAIPEGMELTAGDVVTAPLSGRSQRGVVWDVIPDEGERALKAVESRQDVPPLTGELRDFLDWSARYTVHPPGVFLRMALRHRDSAGEPRTQDVFEPTGQTPPRATEARAAVLAEAAADAGTAADLARRAGVSSGVVTGLEKAGALRRVKRRLDPPFDIPDPDRSGMNLTDGQKRAADELVSLVKRDAYAPVLLDGVTGSGKTEVYFEAIAEALRRSDSAQCLVLLPEIALTQAVTRRFAERFGAAPAVWHSDVSQVERRRVWREVAKGRARIVLGARSALFLPFTDLKVIVVDEEHDGSYKQDDGVVYNARDLAVARAKFAGASAILASATPSLETLVNARRGRYAHVQLPSRPGAATLPETEAINLREQPPERDHWLSPALVKAVAETFERGEQSLLFLNRRGYAPLVICQACGHRMTSPETDSWLVEHRYTGRLVCHLTGFSMPKPKACPECGAEDMLRPVGPGVERIEEEAKARFPEARVETFSSDSAQAPGEVRRLVSRMEAGEIDILVGTQIAAKGHNFPNLTLVGVIDADLGLKGGDLRAAERTYQLLVQVAGRAGRATRPGRALIQSYAPEHEAIQALIAGDRNAFIDAELEARQAYGLPPYGRLAAIVLSGPDQEKLDQWSRRMAAAAPVTDGVEIFGPAEPPIAVIRGRWRRRILARADPGIDLSAYIAAWRTRVKIPPSIRVQVDIDPYSFV